MSRQSFRVLLGVARTCRSLGWTIPEIMDHLRFLATRPLFLTLRLRGEH